METEEPNRPEPAVIAAVSKRTDVLWLSTELQSAEHCTIRTGPGSHEFESTALLVYRDVPARIDYTLSTNEALQRHRVRIEMTAGGQRRILSLDHSDNGWLVDGVPRADLEACMDIDLGWTPATNTLPLRRETIEIGQSIETLAAWVRFPELDVIASAQKYTRLAGNLVRYQSATFEAELVVSPDGIVTTYADSLWKAVAVNRYT